MFNLDKTCFVNSVDPDQLAFQKQLNKIYTVFHSTYKYLEINTWPLLCYQAYRPGVSRANMEYLADLPGNVVAARFKHFYYMFMRGFLHPGGVNYVIYDVEGAQKG